MSAHCFLKRFQPKKIINDLKKYRAIFGNQIPIWKGKKFLRDISGAIL